MCENYESGSRYGSPPIFTWTVLLEHLLCKHVRPACKHLIKQRSLLYSKRVKFDPCCCLVTHDTLLSACIALCSSEIARVTACLFDHILVDHDVPAATRFPGLQGQP